MKPRISVLTDPVPIGAHAVLEPLKQLARRTRNVFRPRPLYLRSQYRGHFARTRSLVEGLRRAGIPATYNPRRISDLSETVVVLAGLPALKQAIALKRCGVIRILMAGPNLVHFPSEARSLTCAPEVDLYLTPASYKTDQFVEDCPELRGRCAVATGGVDPEYWAPITARDARSLVLVYDKPITGRTDDVGRYVSYVRDRGYSCSLLTYGDYTQPQYRDLLRQASLLVGFSGVETHGLAWAEAWAADVPTFLWHQDRYTYDRPGQRDRSYRSSTAPYLTAATGRFFSNFDAFRGLFTEWASNRMPCSPRAWVLDHMTDVVYARRICALANGIAGRAAESQV